MDIFILYRYRFFLRPLGPWCSIAEMDGSLAVSIIIITSTPPQHLLLLLCTADSYRMAFCCVLNGPNGAILSW